MPRATWCPNSHDPTVSCWLCKGDTDYDEDETQSEDTETESRTNGGYEADDEE